MKIYLIQWGYYSCLDGGSELEAIYSTYQKALEHIKSIGRQLEQVKNRKTGEPLDTWTDGDYWISITEGVMDKAFYLDLE
jgi:hypothetical protein